MPLPGIPLAEMFSFKDAMNTVVINVMKHTLLVCAGVLVFAVPGTGRAADDTRALGLDAAEEDGLHATRTFLPEDFDRFAPKNALDMLNQVPGFSIRGGGGGRGLGQATENVLVNGQRLSSKSDNIFDQLRRINAGQVERIEIVDGATLDLPGLSGQVANVYTSSGAISGRYEYRTIHRPKYAEPSYFGGEVSASGTLSTFEWSLAYTHGTGRGAAGGPGYIADGFGNRTEDRDILLHFEGEFPKVSGTLKWNGPNGIVANLNANYGRDYTDFSNDEDRDVFTGIDLFRDFDNRFRGYAYEIGGDIDFDLGPGRLKLIGLKRFDSGDQRSDSLFIYEDDSPDTGSRYAAQSESGEHIGRAEYRWEMLGGDWEIDGEAAFNRLDRSAQLYDLDDTGEYVRIPFPSGSGGVTEDRYEMILTHSRTLIEGLTLQLGGGGEYSEIAQTGPGGLTRTFWRPKGSLSLAWKPKQDLDLSLKLSRVVGQLSFGDFLARVFLDVDNANAGNVELVPTQSWQLDFEVNQGLGDWGSSTLKIYSRWHQDYIDIIPLPGGVESRGNIASATLYGIELENTFNLDPMGWEGAKVDINVRLEESSLTDPLTGEDRSFSYHYDRHADASLRHDIPDTDWAWGVGFQYNHALPYYRLREVGRDYEGPIYTWAFVENKDVFGTTVNFQVFNMTDGRAIYKRTVYDGLRDRSSIAFIERRNLSVQPIFRVQVKGTF